MSGTGGLGDDRSPNKQPPLVTLPFHRLRFLACLGGNLRPPFPSFENRKTGSSSRLKKMLSGAGMQPSASSLVFPTSARHLAWPTPTGLADKSAPALKRAGGDAAMKPDARELTKRRGKKYLCKNTRSGQEGAG